eukprot:848564-Prymnesium_polylepis.2
MTAVSRAHAPRRAAAGGVPCKPATVWRVHTRPSALRAGTMSLFKLPPRSTVLDNTHQRFRALHSLTRIENKTGFGPVRDVVQP